MTLYVIKVKGRIFDTMWIDRFGRYTLFIQEALKFSNSQSAYLYIENFTKYMNKSDVKNFKVWEFQE